MMTQKKRDINNLASSAGNSKLTYKEVEKSPNDYYDLLIQIYKDEQDPDLNEEFELQTDLQDRMDEYTHLISEVENRYCVLYD